MPKKLTTEDKQQILQLYRQQAETTSTLAVRYGVSNSTISRFLKTNLPEAEYELLIQQKRSHRHGGDDMDLPIELPVVESRPVIVLPEIVSAVVAVSVEPKVRKRSVITPRPVVTPPALKSNSWQEPIPEEMPIVPPSNDLKVFLEEASLGVDLDEEDIEADLEEDTIGGWGEPEDEEDDLDDITLASDFPHARGEKVQVIPLSGQELPRICYLVVDRASELIAKPLKDFSDLGQIPSTEYQQKTLPVFDHHKVAQRFSNRFQKVIKVPDGQMLHKTRFHLYAKGITRLLINGQVYSLV
jgi:hypothetical protein